MELNIKKFNEIKTLYCNRYSNKILSLRKKYVEYGGKITIVQFIRLNKQYRTYIEELIYNVLVEFKKYYDMNFCVTLNGSLARYSNNLFSDIDINYLTVGNNYNEIIEIEDKVNYILQKVLHFRGKDRIHSMIVYLPLISDKKLKCIYENKYPLNFIDGVIYNECRNNAEKLMYETYNSTRSLYDIIDYFNENDTKTKLNEWTYCFKFIYNQKLSEIYNSKRMVYRKSRGIEDLIVNLINKIKSDNRYLDANLSVAINSELKDVYKSTVLFNFYELLAIFFRIDKNIKEFNIDEFYKNGAVLDKKIFYYFNKYLMLIQNVQLILDKENIDLSCHNNDFLDIVRMNKFYLKLFGKTSIIKDLNKYKKKLYKMCILNLERML